MTTFLIHAYKPTAIDPLSRRQAAVEFKRRGGHKVTVSCTIPEAERLRLWVAGQDGWRVNRSLASGGLWNARKVGDEQVCPDCDGRGWMRDGEHRTVLCQVCNLTANLKRLQSRQQNT